MTILKRKNILSFFVLISLCVSASLRLICPDEANAQVRATYDSGAVGFAQLLKRLQTTKSVMHIGAHPDDEDSGLLAFLARGENARTAYLSLTRGDGGQNLIGPELFESLGVIRTEELLQARRLDGAEQYFTRAFDFGFSKTLAEAKEKWDEKVILCDAVRAIRLFRPLVVISRFSGTPADGHGQHQFAGYIAPLAVKAAADETQCAGAGEPWQVLKFYVSQGFRDTREPTLKINTGRYDPLLGRSYFEIAMEGRSQHKTQEQGVLELKGEQFSGVNLIQSNVAKVAKETSVFDGIDTSIGGLKNLFKATQLRAENLARAQSAAANALNKYEPNAPQKILPILKQSFSEIRESLRQAHELAFPVRPSSDPTKTVRRAIALEPYGSVAALLGFKHREFTEAIRLAAGIQIDALADKETIVPGEEFRTTVRVFFPKTTSARVKDILLNAPGDWQVDKIDVPKDANPNAFRRETANQAAYFTVKAANGARPTAPYWLADARDGDLYSWRDDANRNLPFQPPVISAAVTLEIEGTEFTFNEPVQYRFADDVRGEIRRNVEVVPEISVAADQDLMIVPYSDEPQTRRVMLTITNFSDASFEGSTCVCAGLIGGWDSRPRSGDFVLKSKGEKASIPFDLTVPAKAKAGNYELLPAVSFSGGVLNQETRTLAYPHIQTHRRFPQLKIKVVVIDLKTAPVKVGYIAGSGDRVAEAIGQMGFDVEMLGENDLTRGDLARFDTIVVGIRAAQVRADFVANHQRLLDYVKNGGTLLVQYQPPSYQNLLPFPAQIGARVVDENARVTILQPAHSIFNFPNKITDEDFKGWIQERNLNSFTTFDAKYTSLLEAHDAGEPENKGGLVVVEMGKGKYIYSSYAFFRQLPAGVPGAYRLFANLLSLPKAK